MKHKKQGKKKGSKEVLSSSSRGRLLVFAVLAGAISGYLLFRARQEPAPVPETPPTETVPSNPEPQSQPLSEGDVLPEVGLVSLQGKPLQLKVEGDTRPVLLYIFSPRCSVCTETIPIWKELFTVAESQSVEVVGISVLDPAQTAPYVQQHQLPWPVYCVADRGSIAALGVQRIPMTFVVEGEGTVAMSLRGRLSEEQRDTISQLIRSGVDQAAMASNQ